MLSKVGLFLLGVTSGAWLVVLAAPEPPPVEHQPPRVVRMLDITMPDAFLDKNTTNRRQRFVCEPVRR